MNVFHLSKIAVLFLLITLGNGGNSFGQVVSGNIEEGNWYRIASNSGNRTNASFTLRDFISRGGHSTVDFRVGISYNHVFGISFTLLNHNFYDYPTFLRVRILSKEVYDPQYLEVYVFRTGAANFSIYDNLQQNGWNPQSWVLGSVPEGYTSTEFEIDHLFAVGNLGNVLTVTRQGSVGIGTTSPGSYKLAVDGKIGAREINVHTSQWADFVFEEGYQLRSIEEVETFIRQNKHLPDMPSENEVIENGINLGEINVKLLQKIEELTIYIIEQERKLQIQEKELKEQKETKEKQLNNLFERVQNLENYFFKARE